MRKFLLLFFLFCTFHITGQVLSNMLSITQTTPANLTICGEAKTFFVHIYNPTPFTITSDTLYITIPSGIQYQGGSLFSSTPGVNFINSFGGIIKVELPSIVNHDSITVTFTANAQCNVLSYISGGGIIRNTARVNYIANNSTRRYDSNNSTTYLIKQPNLTITSITNQSYVGNIGDVFTRCIKVVNGGFGELSGFTLTDVHAAGIQINSVSKGALTQTGLTAKVILSGSDFTSVGDGDSLFESGEMIIICENVTVLNCISANSNFKAFWGCSVNYCQAATATANVVFPNYVPNLVVTPIPSMNTCLGAGNANLQQLKIVNTGLGQAVNVVLDIFLATGSGYNNNTGSYIDMTSFTKQIGAGGSPSSVIPTNVLATNPVACATGTKGKCTVTFPTINSGDTLYLKWNSYNCCYDACNSTVNQRVINGWRYKGTYTNLCQNNYIIYETSGRSYSDIYGQLTPDGSPSTLSNGQTGTFNFLFSNYGNSYPVGTGAYWKFVFTLPTQPCLSYSNIKIVHADGVTTWNPNSVTASGNIVTAIFNGTAPFNLTQAELKINLQLICSLCSGTEEGAAISVKSYYIPDNTCSCEIALSCQTINFNINCPKPCAAGIMFTNFDINRTSLGKPDNEAGGGNGVPDGSGSLNFSKIKTSRVMFGDTISTSFYGVVNTNLSHPTLPYCYATSSVSNGNVLKFLDANLKIYRLGVLIYTCNNITPTAITSGTTTTFSYDLSIPTLLSGTCSPSLPNNYINTQEDSLVLTCRYKDSVNIGNSTPVNSFFSNKFFLSETANPTIDSTKLQCGTINGNCTVIGYWYQNWGGDSYGVKACDNNVIKQNYYLSIGPGNSNDAGGNLFPYEYRNWAHIKQLKAIVPHGYTFISARFMEVRTAGTLLTNSSSWINIAPTDTTSDTLIFNVEHYFQGFGDTLKLSDDGFYGKLEVTIQPSCVALEMVQQNIEYDWTFNPTGFLTGPGSDTTYISRQDDNIIYDPPVIFLQSVLPSIMAKDSIEYWDVIISNTSNTADAMNTWLSGPTISGVNVIQVIDLGTNSSITPIGSGIYPIGTVAAGGTRTFRVKAVYTSCAPDSVIVYCGWNCHAGYPSSVSTYPCTPQRIALTLTPLMPALFVDASAPDTAIQLCDTAMFIVDAKNSALGTAYHLKLTGTVPNGATLLLGTSQLSYPHLAPYVSISDPILLYGNTWQWDISADNSLIGADGFKGVLDTLLNAFKLKFGVTTQCGYQSGSGVNFTLVGVAACKDTSDANVFPSSDLDLQGVSHPYTTSIQISTSYVSPCATSSEIKLLIVNHGPTNFGNTDSVFFKLPNGVSYVPGTFIGIHNPPFTGTPTQTTINGENYLIWRLPPGVVMNDSTVFKFQYSGEPVLLSCGIVNFEAQTKITNSIVCSQTGLACITNSQTGYTSLPVFIYKAYLDFANVTATSVPNPPGGETVTMTYDIINTGQAILVADSVIQYYFDADASGTYTAGDVLIAQDTVIVPENSTLTFTTTFNAPAGKACSIIGVVEPGINNCSCEPAQFIVASQLKSLGNDTTLCSGQTMNMSTAPVTGYLYSWAPTTDLSSGTASDALLTASNTTPSPISIQYILSTNRMNCNASDTIVITVNPLPISNAGTDIVSCPTNVPGNIGTTSLPGYTYHWSPIFGINDTTLSNPTVTLDSVRTMDYIVTTTALGCNSTDTVNVKVNPFPIADAGPDITVCSSGLTDTLGTTTTPGYTYLWTPATYLSSDTISNPIVSFTIPRTTNYIVTAFAYGCNVSDTVVVQVNPLPTATISGSLQTCKNAASPSVVFVGAGGTPPYTFTYHVNNDTNQTVLSMGDSAIVLSATNDTGAFTYYLIGVMDSSITACYQAQSDSIKIRINPLPIATVALGSDSAICQGGPSPTVIFKASGTVAPYTFTYVLDNDTIQLVSGAGDSAVVVVPTDSGHLYVYHLIKVTDSGIATCFLIQNDSVIVDVNPLPIAEIKGATAVCREANSPQVALIGTVGTAPFTFTYHINNGPDQTVTSTNGDTAFVSASTLIDGAFYYYITGAIDGSSTACYKSQNDSVLITIDPLPTATITGTTDICQHSLPTPVTFTGHGGVTPYVFNYTLNNVLQPELSTAIGDSSITIYLPTDTVGVYTYSLISVTDSNTAVCTHPQTGDAIITVKTKPIANFSATAECNGNATQFTDSSSTNTGTITWWNWYLGNGDSLINTQAPFYVYASGGKYNVTLVVNNSFNCTDTLSDTVSVFYNPVANFGHANVCLGDTIHFSDSSVVDTTVFTYDSIQTNIWLFGDGSPTVNNAKDTSHYYSVKGTYNVTLIATSANGCTDVVNIPVKTYDFPQTSFTVPNTCLFDSASFINTSDSATMDHIGKWLWDFGDGTSTDSTNWNAEHLYTAPGDYTFSLITRNSILGCADTLLDTITVYPMPIANFGWSDVCLLDSMYFHDSSVVSTGSINGWQWTFADGSATDTIQNAVHLFTTPSNFNVTLICTTDKGCNDTISHNIVVHPLPTVHFTYVNICDKDSMHFSNTSTIPTTDTLVAWNWQYGDMAIGAGTQVAHLYDTSASYNVTLTVTSAFGCVDSITQTTVVNPNPTVGFISAIQAGCEPLCVILQDTSSIANGGHNTSWLWDFGDSTNSTLSMAEHCYSNDSTFDSVMYSCTLIVTSDSGCISTLIKPNYITVYPKPTAAFVAQPTSTTIINPVITITDMSTGVNYWNWNFGDMDTTALVIPLPHYYADTGTYIITLTTTTQYGCMDTATQSITIEPDFAFYVPNSFTPNGDGINDTFTGKGVFIKTFEMMIFDRWGNLIFYSDDYSKPWDGKANHGQKLAQRDVYVYDIKLTDIKGIEHAYRGTVTLVQ